MTLEGGIPWRALLMACGAGQLALAAVSLTIPRVLGWREETAKLKPLTREVFWTYAGYILSAHVCFGLLSLLGPDLLLERAPLAGLVNGFIGTWWGARLVIQFTLFDRSARPPGRMYVLAEGALISVFVACATFYWTLAVRSFGG